ncbi:MAG: general L-amino acid transport system permease protein, partial [Candidatus Paceibacteria bacterium]
MAAIAEPPQSGFRISQLLYDTRYRSLTIQTIALILFMLGIAWLANNAATNLAALGKPL